MVLFASDTSFLKYDQNLNHLTNIILCSYLCLFVAMDEIILIFLSLKQIRTQRSWTGR